MIDQLNTEINALEKSLDALLKQQEEKRWLPLKTFLELVNAL
jgi:hypothetical protein